MYLIKADDNYINFNNVTRVVRVYSSDSRVRIYMIDGSDVEIKGPEATALINYLEGQCFKIDAGPAPNSPTSDPHSDPASLN